MTRASALGALTASALLQVGTGSQVAAAPATANLSPDEALGRLTSGNERYRRDAAMNCNQNYHRRAEIAGAQAPFAVVLGCADSRVPPEVVFDQRLGDLFVVRLAGNVADEIALGSIEYAIEHFHPALVMVLGHERCGAVTAAVDARKSNIAVPGPVGAIVSAIAPAAERALRAPGDPVHTAIRYNVQDVVSHLRSRSGVLAQAEARRTLRLAGAVYDLHDGGVTAV